MFAAEGEEVEKSYNSKIAPHDKLNFKFVQTDLGDFTLHLAQLIAPPLNGGFFLDWCVLSLCLWGLTFFAWYVFVDASEEDRHHVADEDRACQNAW